MKIVLNEDTDELNNAFQEILGVDEDGAAQMIKQYHEF